MLNAAEDWLRIVVETAVDGVILVDDTGTILVFNPACEKMFGYSSAEAVGTDAGAMIQRPEQGRAIRQRSGNGHYNGSRIFGAGGEMVGRRKDGTTFPLTLSVGQSTRGGQPLYVGIIRDITERKQSEEQRQLLIEQFISSNEERGHFSYVASHDLQEHLRMILSFTALLSEEYGAQLDDKARQYLSLAVNAAKDMRELVDDLLEYGRFGGELEHETPFDAVTEVHRVLSTLAEPIRVSGAEVTVDPMPTLFGNATRFRRLMQNLIGNGLKYVAPGTIPRVQVTVNEDGDHWHFCVKDNGIGIEPVYFDKIFKPFKRLHTRAQYSGTGLGLPICQKIVAGFGGEIWVESTPGAGSSFHFTIPQKEALQ
jgi:two-component system, LuxR family, sensor kinase FixL